MLRINVHDEGDSTRFTIEGKLMVDVAGELEGCWQSALERQPLKPIVVELSAVTFVDTQSRELLARMHRRGVKLVPTGCLMNAIVRQIEADVAASAAGGS